MKKGTVKISFDESRKRWKLAITATASPTGKLVRRWFKTKELAKAERDRLLDAKARHGVAATILAPDTATDAARAVEILKPYGVTLTAAAQIVADAEERRRKSCNFSELYDAYIYNPKKTRREKTLRNYKDTYNHFDTLFGARMISEVGGDEIGRHLDTFTAETARNHFIALRAWFNFAVKNGWATSNPLLTIEIEERAIREIHTMGNADVKELLKAAATHYPALLPYVALGTFCGVRPAELRRLRWEDVNLDDGFVTVTATSSKVKKRRNVEICEALKAWLAPVAKKEGLVVDFTAMTFKRRWKECREKAGLYEGWVADVLRHTYCSNHIAAHGNLATLQIQTGHADLEMLRQHYLNAIPKKAALAFWQIVPKGTPKPKAIKAA